MFLTCKTALKKQVFPKFVIPLTDVTLLPFLPFFSPISHVSSQSFMILETVPRENINNMNTKLNINNITDKSKSRFPLRIRVPEG